MGGFDKAILKRKLLALGWTAADEDATNGDIPLDLQVVPPDELWTNRPKIFYVYDAEQLQEMLGEPIPDDLLPRFPLDDSPEIGLFSPIKGEMIARTIYPEPRLVCMNCGLWRPANVEHCPECNN